MPRFCWLPLAALLLICNAKAHPAEGRITPGLVVETGARTSYADGIAYSPDGKFLYAWGEDKVLRRWRVGLTGFLTTTSTNIRWPLKSGEPRGSVFAFAQSPTGDVGAIGGFGWKDGLVALLDLKKAEVKAVGDPPQRGVVWAMAFSPDGKYLVYGNKFGDLFRLTVATAKVVPFKASLGKGPKPKTNRARLVSFINDKKCLTVAMDGAVRLWDVTDPTAPPYEYARFKVPNIFRAAISPDKRWLAASVVPREGEKEDIKAIGTIEIMKLRGRPDPFLIKVPDGPGSKRAVRCLAFDSSSRLAVGCNDFPKGLKERDFFRILGGSVLTYDLENEKWLPRPIAMGFWAEALAFSPRAKNQLAVAGGENHEVTLYDVTTGKPVGEAAVVRGPGNCIWSVAFGGGGKAHYIAWRANRNPTPTGRSDWGAGEWRVFDRARRAVLPYVPRDFKPTAPLLSTAGWSVQPTASSAVWEVVGPGVRVALKGGDGSVYNTAYNQEPRCWSFIPASGKKPVRLVVGHQWGASLYECDKDGVRLARVMNGHEGAVMCLCPSADGKLLLTGSRDQTICCWSLVDWPAGNEMGASFDVRGGKLVVDQVDKGSPAWEALNPANGTDNDQNRLKKGDVIDLLIIANERFAYDGAGLYKSEARAWGFDLTYTISTRPADALKFLNKIKPSQQYLLGKRIGGRGPVVYKLTTARQRPLWRLFTTRSDVGREWVIWRPRDYFYDTSVNGDSYVGWHVNSVNLGQPPVFHPLEHARGTEAVPAASRKAFHRPDKIWPNLTNPNPTDVEPNIFTDIEAPRVTLSRKAPVAGNPNLEFALDVVPPDATKPGQKISRVVVCLNETELPLDAALQPAMGAALNNATAKVPRALLRWGDNRVTVRAFNEAGVRGEASVGFEYTPPDKPTARLYALCVGNNDYSGSKKRGYSNLLCSEYDAAEMAELLRQHARSKLFAKPKVELVAPKDTRAPEILARLGKLVEEAGPDDLLVVYLSGHGDVKYYEDKKGVPITDAEGNKQPVPGTYLYVCRNYDPKDEDTHLTSRKLFSALAKAKCRKLVILDTCHSGGATLVPSDLARDVSPDGMRFLVVASCQALQACLEPPNLSRKQFQNGFFTHAILDVLTRPRETKAGLRQVPVSSAELKKLLPDKLSGVLKAFDPKLAPGKTYEDYLYQPAFMLPSGRPVSVLCKPNVK